MKNKFFKQFTALSLALAMSLSVFSVASAAEPKKQAKDKAVKETVQEVKQNNVTIELVTQETKKTAKSTVKIKENTTTFKDLQVKLQFNKKALKWTKNKKGDTNLDLLFNKDPNNKGVVNVVASSDKGYQGSGVLFTAYFDIKDAKDTKVALVEEKCMTDVNATITLVGKVAEPDGKWMKNNTGWWYQYEDGTYCQNEFKVIGGKKYYFDQNGYMAVGWKWIDGNWYFFVNSGEMKVGWQWVDGYWYYMNKEGRMQTSWHKIDDKTYYFNGSGVMQTGWQYLNGNWYFFVNSGEMKVGWQWIDGYWYYLDEEGHMATGWKLISNKWYYFNGSGVMQKGWLKQGGNWYFLVNSGEMKVGWQYVSGNWYHFNKSGHMQTGWVKIDGKFYYFYSDGHMAYNETVPGGYRVNGSGVWVK